MTPAERKRTEERALRLARDLAAVTDILYTDARDAAAESFRRYLEVAPRARSLASVATAAERIHSEIEEIVR